MQLQLIRNGYACKKKINENIDALVISNTTIDRPVYLNSKYLYIKGGLSGNSLLEKSIKLYKIYIK